MGYEVDKELAGRTVMIRQTKNSFVREPQYIVYKKVKLDARGCLDLRSLASGGCPCWVATHPGGYEVLHGGMMDGFLSSARVRAALQAGEGVITIVGIDDLEQAWEWCGFVEGYERSERKREESERKREYWAGIFRKVVGPVVQWVEGTEPGPAATAIQSRDPEGPERDQGAMGDDGLLEVVSEQPNVLYGSGLVHRSRGATQTTD